MASASSDLEQAIAVVRPLADQLWGRIATLRSAVARPRVLFTSTDVESGTTLVTAAAALGLARNLREEVHVIEANFARPGLADYLGIPRGPGVADVLDHRATLGQSVQRIASCPNLSVIPAGSPRTAVPGEFATSEARELFRELCETATFTLLDAPPITSSAETRLLLEYVDHVVLVVRARASAKEAVAEAKRLVEDSGTAFLGCVLNRYKSDMPFGAD